MAIGRRPVLSGLACVAAASPLTAIGADVGAEPGATYWSSGQSFAGQNYVAGVDASGTLVGQAPLPDRGHALTARPGGGEAVMCARRPGTFMAVVDLRSGRVDRMVESPDGRHFQGHAVYASNGRLLFATENDFADGRGVIGIYDAADGYTRVGEMSSHEIGPHDIAMAPSGDALIVANGGILTHPDFGRAKQNLDTMAPSLALIDPRDGSLLAEHRLPADLHQLSIRHLAVRPDGAIAAAMQYEGPETDRPPLVGLLRGSGPIRLLSAPEPVQTQMANYCGSVTFDATGMVFAASSPRGGIITFWDAGAGGYLAEAQVPDGCGVAPDGTVGGFMISSGLGGHWRFSVVDGGLGRLGGIGAPIVRWDNHMTRVSA